MLRLRTAIRLLATRNHALHTGLANGCVACASEAPQREDEVVARAGIAAIAIESNLIQESQA